MSQSNGSLTSLLNNEIIPWEVLGFAFFFKF